MNINDAFPSKYLKSGDIPDGQDMILTISHVGIEVVGQGEDAESKPIVYFTETPKGLVLNKTNADSISKLHSPETGNWPGKRIALFATEVDFAGKQTLALRVRLRAPAPAPTSNGHAQPTTAPAAAPAADPIADPLTARWQALAQQARELGLTVPELDPAISREDFIKAGKELAAAVDKARGPF